MTSIAIASDNRTLAFTGSDYADKGVLWLWDIESNAMTRRVAVSRHHDLSGIAFFQDSVVTSGLDGAIRIWTLPEAKLLAEVSTESAVTHSAQHAIFFLHALAVLSRLGVTREPQTLVRVKDIEAPFDVVAIDVAADARFAVVGSADGNSICD